MYLAKASRARNKPFAGSYKRSSISNAAVQSMLRSCCVWRSCYPSKPPPTNTRTSKRTCITIEVSVRTAKKSSRCTGPTGRAGDDAARNAQGSKLLRAPGVRRVYFLATLLLHEIVLDRVGDQLRIVAEVELLQYPRSVRAHGLVGKRDFAGDVLARHA